MKETLARMCSDLTTEQLEQFQIYFEMLVDWNTRMNLTGITKPEEVAKKHFADSLAALPLIGNNASVIDVGTGAGFPGIPLLIANPSLKMTLLDGLNKRILFLEAVLDKLGLTAACIHMRAEDAGRSPRYRERFDVATTRAVASLPVLTELTVPLLKVGGKSIAYKGFAAEELIASKGALHLLHAAAERIEIPADYGERTLVVITKKEPTPKAYPRKAGTPEKNPLGENG
ncbi:MAG: 16S rRNA (guanine(527)-N(7))-methyltransferase RsmG [Clostridia bacterium]